MRAFGTKPGTVHGHLVTVSNGVLFSVETPAQTSDGISKCLAFQRAPDRTLETQGAVKRGRPGSAAPDGLSAENFLGSS